MADVNSPFDQTPIMAPPVRADDQILPHIRWIPIEKSNGYMDLEKSQSNPIYKIAVDLLKNTNFFKAFTTSSNLPSIYIQQFWDTILYDKKAGCYKCQLDQQWFDLTKETLREALQITLVNRNQAFDAPPSIDGLIDFFNQLGYPKLVMNLSTIGIVTRGNIDYAERIWEEFTQSIHTFIEDKRNLSRHTSGKKRATLIVIPSIWFTKLIIHHLQRKHRFHPRPDSPLHLSNEEPVLGYLKFSAQGTKREIFGMPIPSKLITENIREAPYYQEYQENVAKHRGFLADETGSTKDLPAPKPAKPARKPQSTTQKAPLKPSISSSVTSTQHAATSVPAKTEENKRKQATGTTDKPAKAKRIKRSASRKTRQPRSSPKSVGASEAKEVPAEELQVADEDADFQKAVEESMKDVYALPKGPLPPVVIREPESRKYQTLPEVPGKGKAKVTEKQVAHDLLSLQKHNKTSHVDQYIFQRRVSEPTTSSFHDESPYEVLGQSDNKEESEKIVLGVKKGGQDEGQAGPDPNAQAEGQTRSDTGAQAEGQAGSNPDETSEGQAGPDPGNAEARVQSTSSHVVHAGSYREHMDLVVANVSPQPSTEQLYEGFTATVYPNVQENLKLAAEEPVLLEEPASSSGTLSSLQHLKTEVESMVNVSIQQALSSISLMTSPIIDLISRPESPNEHQQLKATTTDTTTTTTTLPPPQAPQQSTTEVMMVKRIVSSFSDFAAQTAGGY
uniref:E-beta-farnesene synthase n=1 Tax=Tanacetum cinerariifolium TaxID=118510 RepID=A0A6L2MW43_TANCI|nr:E-beta-farnesene synthase [Tanacetum cinerariifolium]